MKPHRIVGCGSVILAGMLLAGTLAVRLACPVAAAADQSQKAETLNNESIIESLI